MRPYPNAFLRAFLSLIFAGSLVGCVTPQGIRLPNTGLSAKDLADFNSRNLPNAPWVEPGRLISASGTRLLEPPPGPRVIVVGHVMALQATKEGEEEQAFRNFSKAAAGSGQQPALGRESYARVSVGRTAVRTSGITGVYSQQYMAEVPSDLSPYIQFSSAFGTAMVGTYGDLVAMQLMPLLGPWVTHVLCRKRDPGYADCLARHPTGMFQSVNGHEIDSRLRVVAGGERIHLDSFQRVVRSDD